MQEQCSCAVFKGNFVGNKASVRHAVNVAASCYVQKTPTLILPLKCGFLMHEEENVLKINWSSPP